MRFAASMSLEEQIELLATELERTRSDLRVLQKHHRRSALSTRLSSRNSPTDMSAVVTAERVEVGTQQGNSYHVCAVVPSLGPSGKVCSATVSPVVKAGADRKAVIRK